MNGGRIVGDTQGYVEFGLPWLDGGVRLRVEHGAFELRPHVRLSYAEDLDLGVFSFTPALGFRLPVQGVAHGGAAVTLDVPVQFGLAGASERVGVRIGLGHPGFAVALHADKHVDIDLGIRFENDLTVFPAVAFRGALPLIVGAEGDVGGVRLGGRIEGGPVFLSGNPTWDVAPTLRALLTVGIR
jgi:hypothetical protein